METLCLMLSVDGIGADFVDAFGGLPVALCLRLYVVPHKISGRRRKKVI